MESHGQQLQRGEGDPQHVLDGDANTIWHTRYSPDKATGPHTLTVDMAAPINVKAVLLTPRPDGSNGRVAEYELYLSDDPENFGTPLLKGTVPDEGALQTLTLPTPKTGRYLKLVVKSEHSGQGLASLAEISIVPSD